MYEKSNNKKDLNKIIKEATEKTKQWQKLCLKNGVYKTPDEILKYYEDMKRILLRKNDKKEIYQKNNLKEEYKNGTNK